MAQKRDEHRHAPDLRNDGETSVETFVIDWDGDLYGDVVRVRFLHRLRDERRFASIEELKGQIHSDAARARKLFRDGAAYDVHFQSSKDGLR